MKNGDDAVQGDVARDAVGWRPIETAPRDGTPILIYQPEYEPGERSDWLRVNTWTPCDDDGERTGPDVEYDDNRWAIGYWRPWGGWGNRNSAKVLPTHWMPLPAPPEKP